MFVVDSLGLAIIFCVITMLGWGSWANTQKLAGKDEWPFELYYWDYALGVLFCGVVMALTLGSLGSVGMGALENLGQADSAYIWAALLSGVVFNLSNILLVVAIDAAGMAVAFPVGVGLALVIGTVMSYVQQPRGDALLLTLGVTLVVLAMVMSALAHSRLPAREGESWARGVIFAVVAGGLMGLFYPQLIKAISPSFHDSPLIPGSLTPYAALILFGLGVVASNTVINTIFMKVGRWTYSNYFRGRMKLHLIGILGGAIWMVALTTNLLASGVAGPAISYALGQGATLVAAIWGVFIWKEFRNAPPGTGRYITLMFLGYVTGLLLIGLATL